MQKNEKKVQGFKKVFASKWARFLIILWFAVMIFGMAEGYILGKYIRDNWDTVEGTWQESEVGWLHYRPGRSKFGTRIVYTYTYKGQNYTTTYYSIDRSVQSAYARHAPPGRKQQLLVNPEDPLEVVAYNWSGQHYWPKEIRKRWGKSSRYYYIDNINNPEVEWKPYFR